MPNLTVEDYHIGWICALPKEMTAALADGSQDTVQCNGIFVQYERLPEPTLKSLQQVYELLSQELKQDGRSHVVTYMRAGLASNKLIPALVIECVDQKHKKQLGKHLQKLYDWSYNEHCKSNFQLDLSWLIKESFALPGHCSNV